MKRNSVSARSTAMLLLLLLSAFALTACKSSSTRPESAPTPPRVDCDMGPMSPLPPIPPLAEMDAWAIQVMSQFEAEGFSRTAQDACMAKLREARVIR